MSLGKYRIAQSLILEAGGDFEGPKPEGLIAASEQALGVKYPPSYRQFLLDMGCGDLNGLEIYGVVDANFEESSVPDGIWLTLQERRAGLDPAYILIGEGGDGSYVAIDTRIVDAEAEHPVVRISNVGQLREWVAPNFGTYLLGAVEEVI